ncbi:MULTISPECIES: hypothetical protein [unclassified Blastococcus]
MHALRRPARVAVATAAAVLLLSGCGDDGGDDGGDRAASSASASSASASSSASGSAAPGTGSGSAAPGGDADPAAGAFCDQAREFSAQLGAVGSGTDPAALGPQVAAASAAFDATEPPAEIAAEWALLGDALRGWAGVATTTDLATPEGQARFQQAGQDFLTAVAGPAGQAVATHVSTACPAA